MQADLAQRPSQSIRVLLMPKPQHAGSLSPRFKSSFVLGHSADIRHLRESFSVRGVVARVATLRCWSERGLGGVAALVGVNAAAAVGLGWGGGGSTFRLAGWGVVLIVGCGGGGLSPHIFLACAAAHFG